MNRQLIDRGIEISGEPYETGLSIRTPGRYAMGVAENILTYLDMQSGINVKHTGWQNGFGLEVAVWLPIIRTENFVAEIMTDGEEFYLRRASGSYAGFVVLVNGIVDFLDDRKA